MRADEKGSGAQRPIITDESGSGASGDCWDVSRGLVPCIGLADHAVGHEMKDDWRGKNIG